MVIFHGYVKLPEGRVSGEGKNLVVSNILEYEETYHQYGNKNKQNVYV